MYRFLCMLERLGFEFPSQEEDAFITKNIDLRHYWFSNDEQLPHPHWVSWSIEDSLPNSLLRKFVVNQVVHALTKGWVRFYVYEKLIAQEADMMILALRLMAAIIEKGDKESGAKPEWELKDDKWHRCYYPEDPAHQNQL